MSEIEELRQRVEQLEAQQAALLSGLPYTLGKILKQILSTNAQNAMVVKLYEVSRTLSGASGDSPRGLLAAKIAANLMGIEGHAMDPEFRRSFMRLVPSNEHPEDET